MAKAGFCSICNFETVNLGDIKPYLLDRTDKFAIYSKDNDAFALMCKTCWNDYDAIDSQLYQNMDNCIKTLTWDKPLPKDHTEETPTIIKNIVINNTTNNINYNTSNITPTYNTTNNNTTNKITKIIDPDGIIDPLSSDYKRALRKANKYRVERERKERERKRLELLRIKEENEKRQLQEKYEQAKQIEEEAEKERQACIAREREEALKKKREDELHNKMIRQEEEERKKQNNEIRNKKLYEINMIEKEFNVSFGDNIDYKNKVYNVPQPDEKMKKFNNGLMTFACCHKCKVYKGYPNQFVTSYGKLTENRVVRNKEVVICADCIKEQSQKDAESKSYNMVKCKCGVSYYCATFEAKNKHESSARHIKALGRNKNINGKKYSVLQLRKICNANINPNGTLKVAGFSRMSKEEILSKLLEIEDLVIPEGL